MTAPRGDPHVKSTSPVLFCLLLACLAGCRPDRHEPRIAEARRALDAGHAGPALETLRGLTREGRESGEIHDLIGLSLRSLGKDDEAEQEFLEALRRFPGEPGLYDHLAALYFQKGRTEEATRLWTDAARRFPSYAQAPYNLGSALLAGGRAKEASDWLERAIAIDPNLTAARINLGAVLLTLGQAARAEETLREAARRAPSDPEVAFNLGALYTSARKTGEAIDELRRAVSLRSDFPEARERLGTAYFYAGKPQEALREFREALRLRPDFADAHFGLAVLLTEDGHEGEAIREYEKVLEIQPTHPGATTNLTLLYGRAAFPLARATNRVAALEMFRRAILRRDWQGAWQLISKRSRAFYLDDPERFHLAFLRGFADPKVIARVQSASFFLQYLEPPHVDPASGLPYDPARLRAILDPVSGEWKVDFWVVEALPAPDLYP
jgi:tetratricopeptide (TPR) repeat protein